MQGSLLRGQGPGLVVDRALSAFGESRRDGVRADALRSVVASLHCTSRKRKERPRRAPVNDTALGGNEDLR